MNDEIGTVAALEACIGKMPEPMHLKVIDHLDAGAVRWLAASSLMLAGFADSEIEVSVAGGEPGFVTVVDATRIRLPKVWLDRAGIVRERQAFGALFLVPGVGETLRVNGKVAAVDGNAIEIVVGECYVHCAKALIRSDFWRAEALTTTPSDVAGFLAASRFVALATCHGHGHADLSPKGDPAGVMMRLAEDTAWFADRPGNRRADSFRNILARPRVAVAALIPGAARLALLRGEARLTRDPGVRAAFAVRERTPQLAVGIEAPAIELVDSPALARAKLWPARAPNGVINPAAVLAEHVKLSKQRGLQARLLRAAVSLPGLMQKGLDRDYKTNLY